MNKTKDELIKELQKLQKEYDSLKTSYENDITGHKMAEEELRKKAEQFSVIASSTPDHILVQDNELRYTLVINPQLGLTEQDMHGKTDYDFLSKEEADKLTRVKRYAIETGEPQHLVTSLISKDGKPEFFDGTYIPRFNAQGNADGLIGYFRNVTEARLVEDSLRESEERYRRLVDGSPEAIAVHFEGKFVFVNPAGAKLIGAQSPLELIGRPILDVAHPDSRSKIIERMKQVSEGKEAPLFEEKFVKFDRSVIDVEVVGIPYSYKGEIATQVVVHDITGRKMAEEALRVSETRYHELFNNISSGVAIYEVIGNGNDFIFKDFNRAGERIDGDRKENIIGKSIYEVRPGINNFGLLEVFKRVFATGIPEHYPAKFYVDEKLQGWYDNFVYRLPSGEIVTVYDDITKRKLAEETLRENEEKLREAQAIGLIGSWEFDIENQKILWSDQTYKLYDRNPALGPPTIEEEAAYYSPEQVKTLRKYSQRAIEEGKDFEFDMEAKLTSGRKVYFSGKMQPVKNAYGKVTKLFGTIQDITGRKQVEEALKINEALFREYYDNMKSGSAIFTVINDGSKGSDYIIKKINRIGLKMEGKALEEVVGKSFIDIRPTIDNYGLIPVMKKVWETGESAFLPTRIYIDEHYSNYYENYVFKLPSGEIITLYDDVTESKRSDETLRLEKENFRHSLDDSPLGVRIASIEGNTIYVNKTILNFYGYDSLEELQNTPLKNRYTPESYVEAQKRKHQREHGDFSATDYEISIVRKNKEIRYLRVFRKEVLWDGIRQFQIICNDITERKLADETISILARFPSENPDPVLRIDLIGKLLYANEACYRLLIWKLQIGEKTPSFLQKVITAALKEGISKIIDTEHNHRIISFNIVPVVEAGYANLYGRDITERMQAEEEIRKSKKLLEDLHNHLNEIRENERALISREIHDQIGQSLTALKLDLNWMHKYSITNPEAVAKLEGMIELVTNTIKDVQRISSELRPGILDDLGLAAAIEWYCDEFEKRTAIKCRLSLDDSILGDSKKNLVFFRVLQEALTNVIRHTKASTVTIKLYHTQKGTTLTIQDDGVGITKEKVESAKSLGLIGMRERVRQVVGKVNFSSRTEQGTKLTIFIP